MPPIRHLMSHQPATSPPSSPSGESRALRIPNRCAPWLIRLSLQQLLLPVLAETSIVLPRSPGSQGNHKTRLPAEEREEPEDLLQGKVSFIEQAHAAYCFFLGHNLRGGIDPFA